MQISRHLAFLLLCAQSLSAAGNLEDLEGKSIKPLAGDHRHRAVVYVFMGTDCPISNRLAPEIERLHQTFSSRGVLLRAVYPGQTATAVRNHRQEFSLTLPAFIDAEGAVASEMGITVTPEAVVYLFHDNEREPVLNYRGRVNDLYARLGQSRPAATRNDLQEVLVAIDAGSPLPLRITKAVGCYVGP